MAAARKRKIVAAPQTRKGKPRLRLVRPVLSEARRTLAERIEALEYAREAVAEARRAQENSYDQRLGLERELARLLEKAESRLDSDRIASAARGTLNARKESAAVAAFKTKSKEIERAIANLAKIQDAAQKAIPDRERAFEMSQHYVKAAARDCLAEEIDVDALAASLMKAREAAVADSRRAHVLMSLLPAGSDAYKKLELAMYRDINIGDPPATPEGAEIMKKWDALLKGALK